MNKEFVPYELALRLKALGFDEPCLGVFELIVVGDTVPKFRYNWESEEMWFNHNKNKSEYETHDWYWSAPTFSQAFRWFREKYNLIAEFNWHFPSKCYATSIYPNDFYLQTKSYEQAELACLDELIEIVEGITESN